MLLSANPVGPSLKELHPTRFSPGNSAPQNVIKLTKTKMNRKSLFGHSGQLLAWLIVTFALSFPVAPRAHAQSGGPGADAGLVTSIDDAKLDLREGSKTITYVTTEQTQWLNKRGQQIDAGDVVGKMVEVRFRWITGGSEALSVQLTSGGSNSSGSSRSTMSKSRSSEGGSFSGRWRDPETGTKLKITVNGEHAVMDYSSGTPDAGRVDGNYIYYEGLLREDGKLLKTSGSIRVSDDGTSLTIRQAVFKADGNVLRSETMTYERM